MERKFTVPAKQIFNMELFAFLIALELLMSFSFLGYIHIEPISITISYIPVLLAGCFLGPLHSAALGAVFGLASLWKAFAFYVRPGDRIFSPFLSGEPVQSVLLSLGTRICFGVVIGVLYWIATHRKKYRILWIGVISFFGKQIHSILVYGVMGILFPEYGQGIGEILQNVFSPSEWVVSLFISFFFMVIWKIRESAKMRQYYNYIIEQKKYSHNQSYKKIMPLAIVLLFIFSVILGLYFVNCIRYMMSVHGVELSHEASYDLLHLQFQFLFGAAALFVIVYIVSRVTYDYIVYKVYMNLDKDTLTGVLNRKGFSRIYEHLWKDISLSDHQQCYFLILDVDYFKEINDNCGHPEGDRILKEIANCLNEVFGDLGIIGRLGGDEFLAFTYKPLSKEVFENHIQSLVRKIHKIECGIDKNVSSSIGVVSVVSAAPEKVLYQQADKALYRAKREGRDQYVIIPLNESMEDKTA